MKCSSIRKYGGFLSVFILSNIFVLAYPVFSFAGSIHDAVTVKNRSLIEYYVSQDPFVIGELDAAGRTPLTIAKEQGDEELVRYFTTVRNELERKKTTSVMASTFAMLGTVGRASADFQSDLRRDCGSSSGTTLLSGLSTHHETLHAVGAAGLLQKPQSPRSEGMDTQLENQILFAYKRYVEEIRRVATLPPGFEFPPAFVATKVIHGQVHRVTYLPEVHSTKDTKTANQALNVAQELVKVRGTIFIEYAAASDVAPPSGPIFFDKLVKEMQVLDELRERLIGEGSVELVNYPGIIYSLPRAVHSAKSVAINFVNLEPQAPQSIRAIHARLKELDLLRKQKGGGYQKEIDEEYGALWEEEDRYVTSQEGLQTRDVNQVTTLLELAPEGQSWAIGGLAHAQGVKEVLRQKGWSITEL